VYNRLNMHCLCVEKKRNKDIVPKITQCIDICNSLVVFAACFFSLWFCSFGWFFSRENIFGLIAALFWRHVLTAQVWPLWHTFDHFQHFSKTFQKHTLTRKNFRWVSTYNNSFIFFENISKHTSTPKFLYGSPHITVSWVADKDFSSWFSLANSVTRKLWSS
jgi:hypothetical protein